MQTSKMHNLILFTILSFSVFIYLQYLEVGSFDYDNSPHYALIAKKLLEGGPYSGFEHPPLTILLLAVSFFFGGYTEFAARFSVLIFFVIGGVYTYNLGKTLHSTTTGIISSFFYFFSPFILKGVFLYWMDLLLMVFLTASVYYICRYAKARKDSSILFGGIFAGLAILTKEAALLLFPVYFYVFRKDRTILKLLSIMVFFTLSWLTAYELLDPSSYKYSLLLNFQYPFIKPELGRPEVSAFEILSLFVNELGFFIFFLSLIGGAWLLIREPKKSVTPLLVTIVVIIFFSVLKTKEVRYYLPAVPFILVFASVTFVESFKFISKNRLPRFFMVIFWWSLFGLYAAGFFESFNYFQREWTNSSPQLALLDFVSNHTSPDDFLVFVDDLSYNWVPLYTGRWSSSVFTSFPREAQYSLIQNLSPTYLVVRNPDPTNLYLDNCPKQENIEGIRYNYSVYRCVWR